MKFLSANYSTHSNSLNSGRPSIGLGLTALSLLHEPYLASREIALISGELNVGAKVRAGVGSPFAITSGEAGDSRCREHNAESLVVDCTEQNRNALGS